MVNREKKSGIKYDGLWLRLATTYRKQGLSEDEISKRILCKTTKTLDGGNLDTCDHNAEGKRET